MGYEIMDPHMAIETKRRIMTNRLDEKKCAKSKYLDSDSALCIDGKVVGCSISENLYYYCWHTCGDSYCWTKRLSKYLRCNTWMDCGRDAFLNNAYEIPNVTDSVSEKKPEKKPEEGKKPLDGIDAWVEEMYEIMDPNMAIETKRRIMMNRLDEKKCAKSKYLDSDSALCIDGKVVGCSISENLYYYCWHTCGDSYCWTKRLSKYLRCNTWMDCG